MVDFFLPDSLSFSSGWEMKFYLGAVVWGGGFGGGLLLGHGHGGLPTAPVVRGGGVPIGALREVVEEETPHPPVLLGRRDGGRGVAGPSRVVRKKATTERGQVGLPPP